MSRTSKKRAQVARDTLSDWIDGAMRWRLGGFLALCVVLGGTSQDILSLKVPLYCLSVIVIAGVFASRNRKPIAHLAAPPLLIGGALVALYMLYLVPLPPALWTALPGREPVVAGFELLGQEPAWMPLSLVPDRSLRGLLAFLPPLAVASIALTPVSREEFRNALWALLSVALFSTLLGLAQVMLGLESFRLYAVTNPGLPVGVFSNINHQALLMAAAIPLAFRKIAGADRSGASATDRALAVAAIVILSLGITVSGSIAGYGLLVIALTGSLLLSTGRFALLWLVLIVVATILLLVFSDLLLTDAARTEILTKWGNGSITSRPYIAARIFDHAPYGWVGAGPGAFEAIYRAIEDAGMITGVFVNHAHNDYLELYVEFGLFGVAVALATLGWFFVATVRYLIQRPKGWRRSLLYMLSIGCILLHSGVDYPLRTPAIAALLVFLVLTAQRRFAR
ncbi:MAG: O-antigen ligase family protein [Litorimonas sp.]